MTGSDDPIRDLLVQVVEGDDGLAQLLIAYFKILGNTDETAE